VAKKKRKKKEEEGKGENSHFARGDCRIKAKKEWDAF